MAAPLDAQSSTFKRYMYLWRNYLFSQRGIILIAVLAGALSAWAAGFGVPFVMNKMFPIVFGEAKLPPHLQVYVDRLVAPEHQSDVMLWVAASFLPCVVLFKGMMSFLNVYWLTKAGLRILENLRLQVFTRLQELPLAFHEKNKRGDLLSRFIHNTQFLQEGMLNVSNDLIIQPFTLLSALGYLVYASLENDQVPFLLMNMIVACLCVPLVKKLGSRMLSTARKMLSGLGDITSSLQENLTAQRDIRAFGLEQLQIKQLQGQIRNFFNVMMKMVFWQQAIRPAIEVMSALALAFSLYIGCTNGLTLTEFSALATALYFCYEPIKKLGAVQNSLRMTGAMIEGVNSIIFAEDTLPDPEHPVALPKAKGQVSFQNVSFSYDGKNTVLKDVNVEIEKGEIIALVGPSGSGKTTFINLLSRFYDVEAGSVRIDDIDVRDLSRDDLRTNIALVSQHPVLFKGTIKENIALGNPEKDENAVYEAGNLASVSEFTQEHPDGYDRELGESGEGLSGGQKQRVSIARAFLKDAPIIILDEATASLDMTSEEKIQQSLDSLTQGRTTFVIAHRFSTIRHAHRILVFEKGAIIAEGTHASLYESCALYKDLYDKQINTQEEESAVC